MRVIGEGGGTRDEEPCGGGFSAHPSRFFSAFHQETGQERDRPSGRALVLARLPRGAGDVQVRPIEFLGEARKKAGGGNAAGRPAADIGHVGEIAFQLLDRKSTRLNSSHTVIYTLSLHDALPISNRISWRSAKESRRR